jgi:hypothetical protein
MMMKSWVLVAMLAALLGSTACGDSADTDNGGNAPGNGDRVVVDAPIDELDILVRESFPVQYAARIVSGLPDGCTEFNAAEVTDRSGTTITILVTNTRPAATDIACTAIYGTHESVVELGTDFAQGTTYTVKVNDREATFTAQ